MWTKARGHISKNETKKIPQISLPPTLNRLLWMQEGLRSQNGVISKTSKPLLQDKVIKTTRSLFWTMTNKVASVTIKHRCIDDRLSTTAATATFPAANNATQGGNATIRGLYAQLTTE